MANLTNVKPAATTIDSEPAATLTDITPVASLAHITPAENLTDAETRILILAPTGRDAPAIADLLARADQKSEICRSVACLIAALDEGASGSMIAEEALFGAPARLLTAWAERQPPWSDMAFIILTSRTARTEVMRWRQDLLAGLRGASLLERPLDALTLTSATRAAVRSRQRQYELRAYVTDAAAAAQTLEHQVALRTAELEAALDAVREQMAERERVEDALRQSQKMEAVGQLTGGLAHDFNNMLTGIAGSLELMQTRIAQGRTAEIGRYVAAAMVSAERAAALTHRLLAFSRRQTLNPKPTDVGALIDGMAELIHGTVGPAIRVHQQHRPDLWTVLCDPHQLESALLNLVINARDAMPDGGTLLVQAANGTDDDAYARDLPDADRTQFGVLSVTDSGSGMTPDVVARVFDPFFTTKPTGEGTGLGLSMVYGFVKQSAGHVRIASTPGQGTTLRLYLPRSHAQAIVRGAADQPDPLPPARAGDTVLVVDDEPAVRMLVCEVLGELGYAWAEAADAREGLSVLRSARPIDLLITDVGLPNGMNGRQLADAARRERPNLRVLFITGYAEKAALGPGGLGAGMEVITKPFGLHVLASKIREMMPV